MRPRRLAAAGVVAAVGGGIAALTAPHAFHADAVPAARAVVTLGALVGALLVVAAGGLYRSGMSTGNVGRVAGWTALGTGVMGGVLALTAVGLFAEGAVPRHPAPFGAVVVGVSAAAHLLIGVNDVQRIRAGALDRERRKLSVLARLVRHDLRNDAQVLLGFSDAIVAGVDDPELASHARQVRTIARRVGRLQEGVREVQRLIEDPPPATVIDAADAAERAGTAVREDDPDVSLVVRTPASAAPVRAGERFDRVLVALVGDAARRVTAGPVRLSVDRTGGTVVVTVECPGLEIPAGERDVVLGGDDVTDLRHGSGVALWMARWFADTYGGELAIEEGDEGDVVRLTFPTAPSGSR